MKENSDIKGILYVCKNKLMYTTIFLVSLYVTVNYIFYNEKAIAIYIVQIIMLVSNLCVVLIAWSTRRLDRSKLFDFISYVFVVVIVSNLIIYTVDVDFSGNAQSGMGLFMEYGVYMMILYIEAVRGIFKYINNEKIIIKHHLMRAILIFGVLLLMYNLEFYEGLRVIGIIYFFILCSLNLKDISKWNLVIDKTINYIYFFAIGSFINSLIRIMRLVFDFPVEVAVFSGLVSFITINILAVFTMDNLLNHPYQVMFSKVYNSSLELQNINKDYMEQIKQLEFSQLSLRNAERIIKELLRNMPVPLAIINFNTKRIIYANSLFLELLGGKSLRDLINKNISKFMDIECRDIFDDTNEIRVSRCKLKDDLKNRYLTIEVINSTRENEEIIISITDITSKVNLTKIKDDIKENEFKQTIRKNFLSNISHDLKTPINVIYSATQLESFFVKNNDKESLLKYINISKQNCSSLISLANNIIDIGKIESDNIDTVLVDIEIVEFIEDIVQGLVYYAKDKEIELLFDTNKEEIYLRLDKNAMNRVIVNIISNAIKFTNQNGNILVNIIDEDNIVKIEIIDNGIGMSENVIKNNFKLYNTESKSKNIMEKGSGIGLYVVRNLVIAQGGKINIESERGKGTKVILEFRKEVAKYKYNKKEFKISY